MKRLCTICARGGSKGVPGKNIRPLLGKPLIAWTIEQAKASGLFSHVAVSSDSLEILAVADAAGADLTLRRPDDLASDTARKVDAIKHAVLAAEDALGMRFDVLVDLDATSPLRNVDDIRGAVDLLEREGRTNVITGALARRSPYFNLVETTAEGNAALSKPVAGGIARRQDVPAAFDMNASIYVWDRDKFFENPAIFYPDTGLYEMPEDRSVDIDSELDFKIVETIMRERISSGGHRYGEAFDLTGKLAVVTGAAGILGRHFCRILAEYGARIAVIDRDETAAAELAAQLRSEFPVGASSFVLDVSDPVAVADMVERIEREMGAIDILHNNAASKGPELARFFDNAEDFKPEIWREIMAVNVDGYFFMAREAGSRMARRGRGSIVQTASIYGILGPDQRIYEGAEYLGLQINTPAVYSASKAAVVGLTKYLATYWGANGVRVNTLTPGGVSSGQNEVFDKRYSARVPLGRMARPEEMTGALLYLASDASSYVTGQNLIVDGGLTAW